MGLNFIFLTQRGLVPWVSSGLDWHSTLSLRHLCLHGRHLASLTVSDDIQEDDYYCGHDHYSRPYQTGCSAMADWPSMCPGGVHADIGVQAQTRRKDWLGSRLSIHVSQTNGDECDLCGRFGRTSCGGVWRMAFRGAEHVLSWRMEGQCCVWIWTVL